MVSAYRLPAQDRESIALERTEPRCRATATLDLFTQFGGINPATAGAASSLPGGSVYRSGANTSWSSDHGPSFAPQGYG